MQESITPTPTIGDLMLRSQLFVNQVHNLLSEQSTHKVDDLELVLALLGQVQEDIAAATWMSQGFERTWRAAE